MTAGGTIKTVLISGAGIAGPALAYWLHQYGYRPTIVESVPWVRGGGHLIDIRGTAVDVVERMGLLAQVRSAATHTRHITVVGTHGQAVASITPEQFAGSGAGRDVELPRGHLTNMLYESTRHNVEYLFDDSIMEMNQHANGVEVTLRNNHTRVVDLVVGADGMHSDVRRRTFGPQTQFQNFLGYHYAGFSVPNHLDLDHEARLYNTPGKLIALYATGSDPLVSASLIFASPPVPDYDHRDVERQRQLVRDNFSHTGWESRRVLEALQQADDFYFDSISQIRMPSWTSGRVALVGDAGYAPSLLSGQGTSLALVGAYLLAHKLAASEGNHAVALSAYDAKLRGHVERNQQTALTGARGLIPPNRIQLWLRNQALRAVPFIPRANKVGRNTHAAASSIGLHD